VLVSGRHCFCSSHLSIAISALTQVMIIGSIAENTHSRQLLYQLGIEEPPYASMQGHLLTLAPYSRRGPDLTLVAEPFN